MKKNNRRINIIVLNIGFGVFCLALLLFLYFAPEQTTSYLPHDALHQPFHQITSKKEAEKGCTSCHSESGTSPLAATHPAPYRCLFCHKRNG